MNVFVRIRKSHALRFVPSSKLPYAAIRLEVGLLHEILGVGRVAGHAQSTGVERWHELHRCLGEPRLVSHDPNLPTRLDLGRVDRQI